ncbi:glycoside hydrolase family 3 protein [Streptomyces sp. NPDC090499]|uniref:glycoside hydrolase family 3 protein n=1 Tax=Streptomyces sp. NPDC090499 TaxID=3365965 RepID=UPI0038171EA0
MTTTPALYRDERLPVEERVEDLLARMTIQEKAGLLFHTSILPGDLDAPNANFGSATAGHLIGTAHVSHFNAVGPIENAREFAEFHNRLQECALRTRLGIPVTLSTDPRSHFTDNPGTAARAGAFSQWPEPLGLAAIGSADVVEQFADAVRQEYLAVGIRVALHPQIDLATEPRWSRIAGTFGEDAELTSRLVAAYIRGFQGTSMGAASVSTMAKHFPGGGPQQDGEDPHFDYGREQTYVGGQFDYHLGPFRAAIAAGVRQLMPSYGMPVGTGLEPVAFGFNKRVITELLREELGFDGIVCTDWGLVTDVTVRGQFMPARAWGVEHLDILSRVEAIILAGCDQLGGEACPELVVQLVDSGRVKEERLDTSARRLLREKFVLGLFDQPFVDPDAAAARVGRADFVAAGRRAQRRAVILLTDHADVLPIRPPVRVYAEGIDRTALTARATVVDDLAKADLALLRVTAPHESRPGGFEAMLHAGSLAFSEAEHGRVLGICATVPTVVGIHLERPAVLPEIADAAAALLADFGADDEAFLDVVFGVSRPEGRLPFDLPRSMNAVETSPSDAPFATADPVFRFGHGLRYPPER